MVGLRNPIKFSWTEYGLFRWGNVLCGYIRGMTSRFTLIRCCNGKLMSWRNKLFSSFERGVLVKVKGEIDTGARR